jgi:hypothetical protein
LSSAEPVHRVIKQLPKRRLQLTIITNAALAAATHFTKLIDAALRFQYFPRTWKEAHVYSY